MDADKQGKPKPQTGAIIRKANNVYELPSTKQAIKWMHAVCGFPFKSTRIKAMKAETQLLYASDWPHWDFDAPSSVYDLPFLDDDAKKGIMGRNAARLFGVPDPTA